MSKNISREEIIKKISNVKHPAIDRTLLDLGILKDLTVKENKITITLAFPFPNIPIKDYLINSVKEPLKEIGLEIGINEVVMNQKELQNFLSMEQEAWTGGI